jgi:hypothetical protein
LPIRDTVISPTSQFTYNRSSLSDAGPDNDDDEDSSSQSSWTQCAADLSDYIQLLNELHPSIESCVPVQEANADPNPAPEKQLHDSASSFYKDIIRTKFTGAPPTLVNTLADLNFERYLRLANARHKTLEKP